MTGKIKDKDGKEKTVFNGQRIYMPHPGRMGRSREMGRGPYEKSGLLRETSLPPLRKVEEVFEIPFPYKDSKKMGRPWRDLITDTMDVEIKLWYVPFGEFDGNEVLFFEDKRTIQLKGDWIWRN